jgi:DNA-binding response OmpR family regulator
MNEAAPKAADGRFGRFEIRVAERRLHVDGRVVALGSRAFDLLVALAERRDRVVPNEELISVVWPGLVVEDNNLQVQVSALRKVLGAQSIATIPGRGYQFTVTAGAPDAAAAGPPSAPEVAHVAAGTSRGARLLVVDDNKVNRLMLSRMLELLGHDVSSADNGRTALEKLRTERFDLLLLDLQMPEMDGFDLMERRAIEPSMQNVPIIVTSALEGVTHVARCIELGADDFLRKPVNPVLLKARVHSSLERKFLRDRQRASLARLGPGIHEGPDVNRRGRIEDATLLAACVSGYIAPAGPHGADETLEVLSNWATLMIDAIEGHGGRLQQMTGDGLGASFAPSESPVDDGNPAWGAVQAAKEMSELVRQFNVERIAAGKAAVAMGIGLATGEIVAGYAGTPRRSVYVSVGPAAQRAVRLAELAAAGEQSVLVDGATRSALAGRIDSAALPPTRLPGEPKPVPIYAVPTS